ncbi:MAG: hypothetical protein ABH846_01740 [Patescibacteria group bacterium]
MANIAQIMLKMLGKTPIFGVGLLNVALVPQAVDAFMFRQYVLRF